MIAAFAVLAIAAGVVLPRTLETTPPAAAQAQTPKGGSQSVPVTPGTVVAADVPVVLEAIGTVQPSNTVTIKSRVDGQILASDFTEGRNVETGTVLFRIDPRPFEAALAEAEANKQKNEALLASAQGDLARSAQLVTQGYRSRQTYDQDTAKVAELQAAIKADEAKIATARLNLSYATIKAPIDGRLGARLVDAGNMVRASEAAALVTIAQIRPIDVAFTVPQENQHKVREKQARAPLVAQAIGEDGKTLLSTGKLSMIDNQIDQTTGTLKLKASFANEDERLWPGLFVNVRLIVNMRRGVPTVPAQTVQDGPTGPYAYVIKDDNTVERRAVEIAAVQDGVAVIAKGLTPGEKVVVEGQYRLTNGSRVRLAPPKPDAKSAPTG
ncbi:MAG: efflux RND transporter periplasmic adaptor subunit [Alphaproteobacteria bacterium]